MTDINKLIDRVFEREGRVYENVPGDNGGPTKFGVTIADVRRFINPKATWETVRDLTEAQARKIYVEKYYQEPGFDMLPALIQEVMFDAGILHGPSKAIRMLQEIINEADFGPVDVDGNLGAQTLRCAAAAAHEMGEYLVNAIVEERQQHFDDIVAKNASQSKFRKGWSNRVEGLRRVINPLEYLRSTAAGNDDGGNEGEVEAPDVNGPAWMQSMRADLGVRELPGGKHNPVVLAYFRDAGHPEVKDDETAWCAAVVGAHLERSGVRSTRSLAARSYEKWGVGLDKPRLGCVVVLWRGDPNGWQGHVGLYAGETDTHVILLGGNQGDAVTFAKYPKSRVVKGGYRWPQE